MTLLIVDDHEHFRGFVRMLLTAENFDVTGEAGDGESALEAVQRLHPDVVLLDVQLPGIDGFEVARRLADAGEPAQIVLTSSRQAEDYGTRLTEAPVRGFIPKDEISGAAITALLAA